ncbi:MAG: hypothetical protein WBB01_26295, partial [Phormidesmis sp.]
PGGTPLIKNGARCELSSLKEIRRILKPDGVFICYHFPNQYSWIEAITQHIPGKYNHLYKYTRQGIQQLLQQSNLQLTETSRYAFLPRLIFRNVPDTNLSSQLFNQADAILSWIFSPVCQNHYFVARKNH